MSDPKKLLRLVNKAERLTVQALAAQLRWSQYPGLPAGNVAAAKFDKVTEELGVTFAALRSGLSDPTVPK